jgi:hypothetical protein
MAEILAAGSVRRLEWLFDAIRLSRASGVPIEKLAGEAFDEAEKSPRAAILKPQKDPEGE